MHFATTKLKPLKSVHNLGLKITNQQMEKLPERLAPLSTLLQLKEFLFQNFAVVSCLHYS